MDKEFKIRAYGKQELAQLYLPDNLPSSASAALQRWIDGDEDFKTDMAKAGYHKGQKLLTPKQVKIIVEYLDPPDISL